MNKFQTDLYNNLKALCDTNDAFYFVDQTVIDSDGDINYFRIFSYRLASYTDFLLPGAIECRGIMFEMCEDCDAPKRLAAMPMQKFFNMNENPLTMNLNLSLIDLVMLKADGSLISTYGIKNEVMLKSKTSLHSDQARDSMDYMRKDADFVRDINDLVATGHTVNMEWCSPENRIVIGYMEPELTVLNIRNNETGEYVDVYHPAFAERFPAVSKRLIQRFLIGNVDAFIQDYKYETGIEGYVVRLRDGTWFKLKNEWYLTQHRAKDSINSPRRLYEAVLEEATDDLRSLFYDDPLVIKRIEEMELFVEHKYNNLVATVERFYADNKGLERKEYAIKGQEELPKLYFSLAMGLYVGKEVNFKEFMRAKWKSFGVKDEESTDEQE